MSSRRQIFNRFAEDTFPDLRGTSYSDTSPCTPDYNCIAWAAGESDRWWEPDLLMAGYYWPANARQSYDVLALVDAYESIGYTKCPNGKAQRGYEKVAIYASPTGEWTHGARQLASGRWTSKLGSREDIEHETPQDLCGKEYGTVHCYMRRERS